MLTFSLLSSCSKQGDAPSHQQHCVLTLLLLWLWQKTDLLERTGLGELTNCNSTITGSHVGVARSLKKRKLLWKWSSAARSDGIRLDCGNAKPCYVFYQWLPSFSSLSDPWRELNWGIYVQQFDGPAFDAFSPYNCCVGRVSTRDGQGSYDCIDLVIPLLNPWWIQLVLLFVRGLHPEVLHIPRNLFALFPSSHILRSFLLVSKTKFLINSATNDWTVWKLFWDRLHNLWLRPCL